MISIKQLHYARAVGRTLHFKHAAEECNVSPSALSTALNELENHLGMKIFERDTKKVLITPAGKTVLERAEKILVEVEDLQSMATLNQTPLSAPMSVGFIPTIAPFLLPNLLKEINTKHPGFQLMVSEEQSHVLVEKVRCGELDAGILALPYACEGLLTFEFWQEDFYWIARFDNAFADMHEIGREELEKSQLMLLKEGHCLKDHILDACQMSERQAEHGFSATSLTTLVQMVAGGLGTTLVPEMALKQLLNQNHELASVHLNEPGPHRSIAIIMRPNYPRVTSIEALKKLAQDALSPLRKGSFD
ncbi:LysR family transcriptional regulator [Oleiphilus sp. HI0130]|jgi:LysR family hydrogen peroxide-inducible transcriptional activator|nr:LysR family transcriptional regulator [Oleiphilus sp. HI0130]